MQRRSVARIWAPAYICPAVPDAARAAGAEVRYFPVDVALHPDVEELRRSIAAGDAVLMVDYFGRPPHADFIALTRERPDLLWIEDRAQALDTGAPTWGTVTLFSPRKLFGIGDGGVLVGEGDLPIAETGAEGDENRLWAPHVARSADPEGGSPQAWYGAFRRREDAFVADDPAPMSARSIASLKRIDFQIHSNARRANYAALAHRLRDLLLWPDVLTPSFAPLAVPLRVHDATAVARRLADQRIYCARHWAEVPSPLEVYEAAHRLSRQQLSIPCDPTYGPEELARVAEAVAAAADGGAL